VVSIKTSKTVHEHVDNPILRQFFGDTPGEDHPTKEVGLGSGVIVSQDGFILTNNHVVEDADELTVVLSDDREFPAKVVGADPKTDVAVVKIETTGLQAITFADSDKLRVGDVVFAIGNPLDVGETVTMGIVSAKNRNVNLLDDVGGYEDFIQTDAAINLGNSGGALVNTAGDLVGINTLLIGKAADAEGIGFAIPVDTATNVLHQLITTGHVVRGWMGADYGFVPVAADSGLPSAARGVQVTDVYPGGPAAQAGIQVHDILLRIGDVDILDPAGLRRREAALKPGSTVTVSGLRNGSPFHLDVTLAQRPPTPPNASSSLDGS
jgi:serine protease DegS/serine protease DegQ